MALVFLYILSTWQNGLLEVLVESLPRRAEAVAFTRKGEGTFSLGFGMRCPAKLIEM